MAARKNKIEVALTLSIDQFKTAVKTVDNEFKRVVRSGQAFRGTMNNLNGHANTLRSSLLQLGTALAGGAVFGAATKAAFGFNQTLEQSKIGIAALVRAFDGVDMETSFSVAEDIQKRLQIAGLKTTATYSELLRALQEGIGPALRENFDPAQIVSFATSMTQAAAALSLPMDQLGQELRAILDGTIDRNARIAKALQIDNKTIKEWKAAGTLFENLQEKLKAFAAAGDQAALTFGGAFSNMTDAIQMALGSGTQKSFKATTSAILRLTSAIVTIDDEAGTFAFNEKIMSAMDDIDKRISDFLANLSTEDIAAALENIIKTAAAIVDILGSFGGAIVAVVDIAGPFAPLLANLAGNFLLLSTASKLVGFALLEPYRLIKAIAAQSAILKTTSLAAWFGELSTGIPRTGAVLSTFTTVLRSASGVLLAFGVGWQIGKLLNKFDIVKKAGIALSAGFTKGFLKIKKAWTWVSGGDTAAIQREIDEAEQIFSEMFAEVVTQAKKAAKDVDKSYKDIGAAAKQSAEVQKQAQAAATDEMKKQYQQYADEVKRLQDDIAGRAQSLADELRAMGRTGMSDLGAWQDRKKEAQEYEAAAKKAAAAGNFEDAAALADKAKAAYRDLNKEVKISTTTLIKMKLAQAEAMKNSGWRTGSYREYLALQKQVAALQRKVAKEGADSQSVMVSSSEALKTAMDGVKSSGELATDALTKQKEAAKKAADALNEKADWQLGDAFTEAGKAAKLLVEQAENLNKVIEESGGEWSKVWDQMERDATTAIDASEQRIVKLTRDREVTLYINEVVKKRLGGMIQRFAAGGRLSGYGGGDRIPALLEAGEYIIRKEAVSRFGAGIFHALNNLRLPALPGFASGGPAGAGGGGETVNINLTLPGSAGPVALQASRSGADQLLRDVARMQRLRSRK